ACTRSASMTGRAPSTSSRAVRLPPPRVPTATRLSASPSGTRPWCWQSTSSAPCPPCSRACRLRHPSSSSARAPACWGSPSRTCCGSTTPRCRRRRPPQPRRTEAPRLWKYPSPPSSRTCLTCCPSSPSTLLRYPTKPTPMTRTTKCRRGHPSHLPTTQAHRCRSWQCAPCHGATRWRPPNCSPSAAARPSTSCWRPTACTSRSSLRRWSTPSTLSQARLRSCWWRMSAATLMLRPASSACSASVSRSAMCPRTSRTRAGGHQRTSTSLWPESARARLWR
ncbi:hypothetical protein HK405_009014, partial [Cladochytrium tenue]